MTIFLRFSPKVFPFEHLRPFRLISSALGKRWFSHLEVLENGNLINFPTRNILEKAKLYPRVHLDLGTGDGKYVYRQARVETQTFFIGIDEKASDMAQISWKVARKPSRGGIPNTAFISSSVENLPIEFSAIANSISINFPWGTLLNGLVSPNQEFLKKISCLGKKGASVEILLNYTVFNDGEYLRRIKLAHVDESYLKAKLIPTYLESGITVTSYKIEALSKNRSTWGQHLTLGSQREVLRLMGKIN